MPPPCLLPREGSRKAKPGRRVGLPFDHTPRASNALSPAPVSLGGIHRKRTSDEEVGDIANKRRRISPSVASSSSLVSDRTDRIGQQVAVIDLTDDSPQASSSGLERSTKSTASLALGSPSSKAQSFPRYSRPRSASIPSHGAKQKSEVIDLTLDDDFEGSTLPSTSRLKETALSEVINEVIDLTVEDPAAPDVLVASPCQRPEPVLQHGPGQTSSANDDHSAPTKSPGYGDPRASQEGLRSALSLETPQGQPLRSSKPAQKEIATDVDQAPVSSPMSQTRNTFQSQPNLGLALDTSAVVCPSHRDEAVVHSSIAPLRETLKHGKLSRAGQSLRLARPAQMPSFPHVQPNANVGIDSQDSLHSMRATKPIKAAGPDANRLSILGTGGDAHRTQAWHGATTANSDSVSPNGSSKSFFSELKNSSGSRPSSALGMPQHLANGLPSLGHMRQVEKDQLQRRPVVVPRVQVQDRDHDPRKIDGKPKNAEKKRAGDGRFDMSGSIAQFDAAESDAGPDESDGLSRVDLFTMQQMLLRRSRGDVIARNTPLSDVGPTQGRDSDVKNYSAQFQGRSGGGRQTGGIERDDKGSIVSRSGPLYASELREPSGLMVQGEAQKQNELVTDGLAEGNEERDASNSSSFSPETNAQGNDRPRNLLQKRPRQWRRKLEKIVILRAPSRELQRISERPVQRPDLPMGECFLMRCPMEVQQMIYKHLLVADGPIQVINGWSKLHQRQRSYLHPAILLTCRTFFRNASAVLYGQNVFQYILRETAPFAAEFREGEQSIDIARYTPCFRKLELKIERSRTDFAYCTALARAICVLNTHGAMLNQLVLDISPSVEGNTLSTVGYFYRQGEVMEALKALRTSFIEVRVLTPKTRSTAPASISCLIDRRFTVDDTSELPWAQPVKKPLEDLSEMISLACENPSEAVARELFKKFEPTSRRGIERGRTKKKDQDDKQGSNDNNDDQSGEGDNDDQSSDGDGDDQSSNDDEELYIDDGDDSGDFKG